ncbi:putative CRISPR-associated protein [Crocosphaera sp. XPORK-15E]|uniref:putative CRISPR-associated protein n=1 Tax=Crocosphaera sp. XPORK-15E TaxID=3110247 RepID=UPI002B1E93F1|nr:putative CRISPR-associated protein [Crocosphaera sp. XPORK-15E]MEA5537323.1 putative CRISPR-associated protein [Crocosphaera sp. XPORK-15E]
MKNKKSLPKVIISTVGTSLLTNQINRNAQESEGDWFKMLSKYANETWENTPSEVQDIIRELETRASEKLKQNDLGKLRKLSAELNGIYGIYDNNIIEGKRDFHYLISTDTAQGKITAEIVKDYLLSQGLMVDIYTPSGLSTANTIAFSEGIDQLIVWLREDIVKNYQDHHKIYFNLVGGFKSLQGYLNTLAMFYADAIAYIFEGENSELITIPRLPITVDKTAIEDYKVLLALMNAGADLPIQDALEIPESLVYVVDEEMTLSTWGKLVWAECKNQFLSEELLEFTNLEYLDSFRRDYNNVNDKSQRVKLQETLAKVSYLLHKYQGDRGVLRRDGGILYETYTQYSNIEHFRVSLNWRVSCISDNEKLVLRHFGQEESVNNNP